MTSRRDVGWLTDLADTLDKVSEFLRSPQGGAALNEYYAARSPSPCLGPGTEPGNLIDAVGFTELWLRSKITQHTQRP
jgi:hypothetical protein